MFVIAELLDNVGDLRGRLSRSVHVALLPHNVLLLLKPVLLRPQHGSRPTNAQPSNRLRRRKLEMFHHVTSDERSRPAQSCFAMYRRRALHLLCDCQKFAKNVKWRRRTVSKKEVKMVESRLHKPRRRINFLVQSNHRRNVMFPEVWKIGFRRVQGISVFNLRLGMRARKGKEFSGKYPVEVTVLDSLVIFVLFHVERSKVEEIELDRLAQAVETVQQCQIVCTLPE